MVVSTSIVTLASILRAVSMHPTEQCDDSNSFDDLSVNGGIYCDGSQRHFNHVTNVNA